MSTLSIPDPIKVVTGLTIYPAALVADQQRDLVEILRAGLAAAPLFVPMMPRSGRPFSVRMSNFGPLGWVSDKAGYRYQPTHPDTGQPWPAIPEILLQIWDQVSGYPHPPEAALLNWYGPDAKMGLHQDSDEADLQAPVVSLSLGDDALFRYQVPGQSSSASFKLHSGDILVMGGPMRLCRHGVSRIYPGTSVLLPAPGRINITMRRVNLPGETPR